MAQVNHLSYPRLMCPPVIWQRIRRLSRDIQDSQYILRQPGRAGLGLGGFRVRLVWIAEETILDGGGVSFFKATSQRPACLLLLYQ